MARSRQGRDRADHHRYRARHRRNAAAPRSRRSFLLGHSRVNEPLVQSMTSQLIVRFRDRILSGTYAPGSALRQDRLAAEFGTSKIPVREALVQLQVRRIGRHLSQSRFSGAPAGRPRTRRSLQPAVADRAAAVARGAKLANSADHAAARSGARPIECGHGRGGVRLLRPVQPGVSLAAHRAAIAARGGRDVRKRLHTLAQRYVQAHFGPMGA